MKYARFWIPVLLWMVIIFVFSSKQRLQVSDVLLVQFAFFKSLHVIEYAFLYALWYRALRNTTELSQQQCVGVSFGATIIYAISDEAHQTFVPTREGTLRDVLIDSLGVLLAAGFLWKLLPQAPKKLKVWAKNWQLL